MPPAYVWRELLFADEHPPLADNLFAPRQYSAEAEQKAWRNVQYAPGES